MTDLLEYTNHAKVVQKWRQSSAKVASPIDGRKLTNANPNSSQSK
ncbi:hypothetical protein [Sporomusa malonica]|nr:hypothetical protein [Sporomusa malonica]